jgi:uncharacterized protein YaaR (DUF327 family)|tara:strand:- start:55 stop:300 length:246 start_codon:yes stop_codon:yes gene_type:complete
MTYQPLFPFMYDDSKRTSQAGLECLVSAAFSTGDMILYETCLKEVDDYNETTDNICFVTYLVNTHYQNKDDEKEEDNKRHS